MAFDLASFEAEVALKLIPTDRLPSIAQDALEVGFDGPHVVRMAILEPNAGWAIDQVLPLMLTELGCRTLSPAEAALRLARQRAQRILGTGEDPLPSLPYFYRLMFSAERPPDLIELGRLGMAFEYLRVEFLREENIEAKRARVREALENLLSPELREQRYAARKAAWEQARKRAKTEWPYVLNSSTGRARLMRRYKDNLTGIWILVYIDLVAWGLIGIFASWRTTVFGFIMTVPLLFIFALWREYRGMKWERRDLLLRRGIPDDQI